MFYHDNSLKAVGGEKNLLKPELKFSKECLCLTFSPARSHAEILRLLHHRAASLKVHTPTDTHSHTRSGCARSRLSELVSFHSAFHGKLHSLKRKRGEKFLYDFLIFFLSGNQATHPPQVW